MHSNYQARQAQENALKEDPTIYQYDELYDDMTATREESKKAKTEEVKNSKYIAKLLVTAEKRKKEHERRIERQVQKERETEGDIYKDKEIFVTAAYRAKLEEMKMAEEAERREEYLEGIGDVTKQRDLGGFYRHLYEQKMGADKKENVVAEQEESVDVPEEPSTSKTTTEPKAREKKPRTYRKRLSNENDDDDDDDGKSGSKDDQVKTHLPSNIDADSDFSIDSDSDEDSDDGKKGDKPDKKKEAIGKKDVKVADSSEETPKADESSASGPELQHDFIKPNSSPVKRPGREEDSKSESEDKSAEPIIEEVKIKIDIWKKRTVGDIFDAALQRYYERKQTRKG